VFDKNKVFVVSYACSKIVQLYHTMRSARPAWS